MSFITKFFSWVKGLLSKVTPEVKSFVEIGIKLVENIKNYADNPAIDVLTAIIPTDIDDKVVAAIRAVLPKLLAELQFIDTALTNDEIVQFIDKLQTAGDDAIDIFTHGISSVINNKITDEIGSISQAFLTTEIVYRGEVAAAKAAE